MESIAYFNWVDLTFLIIFILSTYIGAQRGLFGELFYFLGLYAIIILSIRFSYSTAQIVNRYLFIPLNVCYVISFLVIVLFFYLLFKTIYAALLKIAKIEVFHTVNKIGGLLVGLMRGFILSILVSFILALIPFSYTSESVRVYSLSGNFFLRAGGILYKKTVGILTRTEDNRVEQLLSSVAPAQFRILKIKRKDRLEEFLDEQ